MKLKKFCRTIFLFFYRSFSNYILRMCDCFLNHKKSAIDLYIARFLIVNKNYSIIMRMGRTLIAE